MRVFARRGTRKAAAPDAAQPPAEDPIPGEVPSPVLELADPAPDPAQPPAEDPIPGEPAVPVLELAGSAPGPAPAPAEDPIPGEPAVPVLELAGCAKTYPGVPPVHALRPVDLTVWSGDYLAVVGPSGSGKSTLLNLLGLLDRPTSGAYRLGGVDVGGVGERERAALRGRRVGFVFQAFHLLPYRTALENVALAQLYVTARPGPRTAAAADALTRVGLGHRLHALPTTMSGGERQRVAIARALVNAPDLLLCDEPTGNLDSATAAAVMDLLEELNATGVTVLVITHDPAVAARARRQVTILDGHLTETGLTETGVGVASEVA